MSFKRLSQIFFYIVVVAAVCMLLLLFGIWGLMCGMRTSNLSVTEKVSNDEGKHHVTSIYIHDSRATMHNNSLEFGCQDKLSGQNHFPERNIPKMEEISNVDNSFPPPPSESFLESINLN